MHVVARLSDYLLTQLRTALARDHTLHAVPTWGDLGGVFRGRAVDVAVLEPTPVGPDELAPLLRLLASHPAVPVIVYTSVSPAAMRVTVELARRGVHHVVFRGIDDAPGRFRALMQDLADTSWRSTLWSWVERRVARAPAPLERAVRELFNAPHQFSDVSDLANASGLTRRTVERWLTRVGIASAKLLVVSARVERAHHLMRSSSSDVATVAERVGYSSPRLFARQVALVTGWPPTALRYAVTNDVLVARLTAALAIPVAGDGASLVDGFGRALVPAAEYGDLLAPAPFTLPPEAVASSRTRGREAHE
jgi:AraC-like DNA-binding protein